MVSSVSSQIFFASARATAEIFIVGAVGALARKNGALSATLARALGKFNGTFFLPMLLWTSLARTVTISSAKELWVMPVLAIVHISAGLVIGYHGVVRGCKTASGFRTCACLGAAFGNSLAYPIVVTRAITRNPRIGRLVFKDPGDSDRCALYLSAYVITLSFSMWSLGPYLFRRRLMEIKAKDDDIEMRELKDDDAERAAESVANDSTRLVSESGTTASFDAGVEPLRAWKPDGSQTWVVVVRDVCNANVIACVLGVATGMCTPVRDILFQPGRALSFIGSAANILADAAIPTILIVIGASLANGPDYTWADKKTAIAVLITRFVIMPCLTVAVYYGIKDAGFAPRDQVFWLAFLLLGATPTANNMMLQCQMYHPDERAAAGMATILFYQYAAAPLLLTASISVFLAIIEPTTT